MTEVYILSYEDDSEGIASHYPMGAFSTLEKAQEYAAADWDDIQMIVETELRWEYSEVGKYWSTDPAEKQWFEVVKFEVDKEYPTRYIVSGNRYAGGVSCPRE